MHFIDYIFLISQSPLKIVKTSLFFKCDLIYKSIIELSPFGKEISFLFFKQYIGSINKGKIWMKKQQYKHKGDKKRGDFKANSWAMETTLKPV